MTYKENDFKFDQLVQTNDPDIDERVCKSDPLHFDGLFRTIHSRLQNEEFEAIVQEISDHIPTKEIIESFDTIMDFAALRDLGYIAAWMNQKGVPIANVDGLSNALILLSQKTGEVPRDTVYSYGLRNPKDARMRTFTNLTEERLFIQSFTKGMKGLDKCIELLVSLSNIPISSSEFAGKVRAAQEWLVSMRRAILEVYAQITPEIFTYSLRPYFDPIVINGKEYLAPGGAQMPIILIDLMIWAASTADSEYIFYVNDNLRYCPLKYRSLASEIQEKYLTITCRVVREYSEVHDSQSKISSRESLIALSDLLTELIKFRRPHLKVAQDNFRLRTDVQLGSGGYRPDLLEKLIRKTEESKSIISNLLRE